MCCSWWVLFVITFYQSKDERDAAKAHKNTASLVNLVVYSVSKTPDSRVNDKIIWKCVPRRVFLIFFNTQKALLVSEHVITSA